MDPSKPRQMLEPGRTAFIFDLDGTLVDSVWDLLAARSAQALGVGIYY